MDRRSSKKLKKRMHEKWKRESSPVSSHGVLSATEVSSQIKQDHFESAKFESEGGLSYELTNTVHSASGLRAKFKNNPDKQSTTVTTPFGFYPTGCLLFRHQSSSEDVSEADDDDDWTVNEQNTSADEDAVDDAWSVNDQTTVYISPLDGYGFNFGLSLDSIFKKTNTPKSVLDDKTNELSALSAKSIGCHDVRENLCTSSGFRSEVANNTQPCVLEPGFESLKRINVQWNDNYPTGGSLSCDLKDGAMKDSSIKVFTCGPMFVGNSL
jgi:hypothetical protein